MKIRKTYPWRYLQNPVGLLRDVTAYGIDRQRAAGAMTTEGDKLTAKVMHTLGTVCESLSTGQYGEALLNRVNILEHKAWQYAETHEGYEQEAEEWDEGDDEPTDYDFGWWVADAKWWHPRSYKLHAWLPRVLRATSYVYGVVASTHDEYLFDHWPDKLSRILDDAVMTTIGHFTRFDSYARSEQETLRIARRMELPYRVADIFAGAPVPDDAIAAVDLVLMIDAYEDAYSLGPPFTRPPTKALLKYEEDVRTGKRGR